MHLIAELMNMIASLAALAVAYIMYREVRRDRNQDRDE